MHILAETSCCGIHRIVKPVKLQDEDLPRCRKRQARPCCLNSIWGASHRTEMTDDAGQAGVGILAFIILDTVPLNCSKTLLQRL